MTNKSKNSVKVILAAAITGVIAGLMLAPKSGKELRKDIKVVVQKIGEEVVEKAEKVKKLSKREYEKIVEKVTQAYAQAKKIKEEDFKHITEEAKKGWAEISKKLKTKK